ncbi:glycosyltransferase family 2 protein [Flavobacterium sp. IB48]|uniref:glycosyltransferase family 2 protein n=1 Tax=Flavobacterium sp. IB48 TaxID=2779375 RepID=UPI0018E8364B|nr:glycosyltransferase family 2 protein [Flavobacterium sp. IB48]MBJ2126443.1 glycosyltransferase family 2 protein [Flavobacterium sp. IB48]
MISVCMASYNGGKYIKRQISSILKQLGENDELIISDDGSIDDTIEIIESFKDVRIVLLRHQKNESRRKKTYPHYLVSANYENALKHSKGQFIFLADQDDIWENNKIEIMMPYMNKHSAVMSNCSVINEMDEMVSNSFFKPIKLPRGLFQNISKPVYHGCCMAFNRDVLNIALPFPTQMILHDTWIGVLAESFGNVKFIDDKLVQYRRHLKNSSFAEGKSTNSLLFRIQYRMELFFQVSKRIISKKIKK